MESGIHILLKSKIVSSKIEQAHLISKRALVVIQEGKTMFYAPGIFNELLISFGIIQRTIDSSKTM